MTFLLISNSAVNHNHCGGTSIFSIHYIQEIHNVSVIPFYVYMDRTPLLKVKFHIILLSIFHGSRDTLKSQFLFSTIPLRHF